MPARKSQRLSFCILLIDKAAQARMAESETSALPAAGVASGFSVHGEHDATAKFIAGLRAH